MLTVLRHGDLPIKQGGGLKLPDHASMCFTATGRGALAHLAQKLDCPRVLLPGFVPEGLLLPFVAAGKHVEFYRLNGKLEPDALVIGDGDLMVVIHYFGRIVDTANIIGAAHACGAMVLEDCAHAPLHRPERADFTLYSFNKALPIADGAILLSRRPEIDVRRGAGAMPMPLDATIAYENHLRANGEIARHGIEHNATADVLRSAAAYQRYYDIMGGDMALYAPSAKARLALAMADTDKIATQPWRAHRVRSDKEGEAVALELWKRGIHASDARTHWYAPSGHPDQNFLIVPPDTDEAVFAAFEAAHK